MPPSLDHIIILLPHETCKDLPPSPTSAFTIYPGGTHADGQTANSLILLQSGVYLELISFVDDLPTNKEGHWWGTKTPGTIIDWALTTPSVTDVEAVRQKLKTSKANSGLGSPLDQDEEGATRVNYLDPVKGGRKRPDGEMVEWQVIFPTSNVSRGTLPFWCHDITPRNLRVPITSSSSNSTSFTKHPSGAIGVAKVVLVVNSTHFPQLVEIYREILGVEGVQSRDREVGFVISQPTEGSKEMVIVLREAWEEGEKNLVVVNGGVVGIWEIVLAVEGNAPVALEERIGDGVMRIGFEKA